ncbi:MAG TPA: hypothetical protein VGX69_01855 [Solirubrobacteraceae bacterium]|nr:hypothetical protein [Solirubrobacteraceae bacterium]
MAELTLHSRPVQTVFDLLGDKEDDITYSVGWGLAQSEAFARALLAEAFGAAEQGEITAIRLQESAPGTGRTDVELETERLHLVLEAKRGWNLPTEAQLQQYADRLNERDDRRGRIVVVAECARYYPPVKTLPKSLDGVPVLYLPWKRIAEIAMNMAAASRSHAEKRLLADLTSYLKGLMTMQDVTSNMVFVVVLGQDPLKWSTLTFKDTVIERGFYYHPVGGRKGWPHTPPNYIAFRFDGRLQQVRHVDNYEVITRPHDYIPEIIPQADWSDEPHFLYTLGPPIEPAKPVRNGKIWPNARLWCAFDLLLTCETIGEARDKTQARLAVAGEAAV